MAKARPNPPVIHLIVAMVVLLVPILLITAWFTRLPAPAVNVVDYRPVVRAARAADPYPVLAPPSLPDGWLATRARWTPRGEPGVNREPAPGNTVALGFLSPDKKYIAIDQRDEQPELFTRDITRDGRPEGDSRVGDRTWRRFVSDDDRTRSLVLLEPTHVTIVSGDVPFEALESFAAMLTAK